MKRGERGEEGREEGEYVEMEMQKVCGSMCMDISKHILAYYAFIYIGLEVSLQSIHVKKSTM